MPQWHVANAIGAAMAKNTSEVTLFADTERGIALAPEEAFSRRVGKDFDRKTRNLACLRAAPGKMRQSRRLGIRTRSEVVEDIQFNMVRGFYYRGRNIRVKVQTRPGLIPEYQELAQSMFNYCLLPGAI